MTDLDMKLETEIGGLQSEIGAIQLQIGTLHSDAATAGELAAFSERVGGVEALRWWPVKTKSWPATPTCTLSLLRSPWSLPQCRQMHLPLCH